MKKILKMFSAAVVMAAFAVVFAACDTGTQTTTPAALTSTTEYIPITPLNASVDNFADLQSAIASGGTQTITITQDISMTAQITVPIDANITLITNNSSGVSLTWNGTNDAPRHFSVQHGGTLNLGISSGTAVQNNITIAGRAPQGGGGIVMQSLGNLIAVFNMNGGEIRDINRTLAAFDGSGVSVNGGTFNMIGGTITNNSTTGVGGGVHIFNGGSFIMNGGNIANNTASSGENVNVLNGTFTHNSGTIANGIPTITSGTTSNHTAGTVFTSATPTATSSVSPITWVADSGSLPSGVTLNANTGVVTGTAASTAGTFTIRARTPVGDSVDAITVTVAATSTTPPPVSPPPPSVGAAPVTSITFASITSHAPAAAIRGPNISGYVSVPFTVIDVPSGANVRWIFQGSEVPPASTTNNGNTLNLNRTFHGGTPLAAGNHHITVIGTIGGRSFSRVIAINVR